MKKKTQQQKTKQNKTKQKTINNKRKQNTKWRLLQNYKNADTTFLHSHDELFV